MRYIKFISILLILQACKISEPSHSKYISDSICLDTTTYFPLDLAKNRGDSLIIYGESAYLKAINEKKIYGCLLENDVLRLTYRRAFHEPVMIRITKDSLIIKYDVEAIVDQSVYNMTKLSEDECEIWEAFDEYDSYIRFDQTENADSILKLYPKILDSSYIKNLENKMYEPEFVKHHLRTQKVKITKREYRILLDSIDMSTFWMKDNFNHVFAGMDGSDYLLEVSTKDHYHFVYDWQPNEDFKKVCKLLLNYTDIKESDIY